MTTQDGHAQAARCPTAAQKAAAERIARDKADGYAVVNDADA